MLVVRTRIVVFLNKKKRNRFPYSKRKNHLIVSACLTSELAPGAGNSNVSSRLCSLCRTKIERKVCERYYIYIPMIETNSLHSLDRVISIRMRTNIYTEREDVQQFLEYIHRRADIRAQLLYYFSSRFFHRVPYFPSLYHLYLYIRIYTIYITFITRLRTL